MEISGRVQNGVVVLEGEAKLPEGARVTVVYRPVVTVAQAGKRRIELPLVRTGEPGTLKLTAEMIAEIFADEDVASFRRACGRPATSGDEAADEPPST